MSKESVKKFHNGIVKKSILIQAPKEKVWRTVSNIEGLGRWVINVKKTVYLSKTKRGIGTIRNISFADGSQVEEHVVSWINKKSFSYIAVTGMPLRIYFATISLEPKGSGKTQVTWKTYLSSKKITKKQFSEFVLFLNDFYQTSLKNLKSKLEK